MRILSETFEKGYAPKEMVGKVKDLQSFMGEVVGASMAITLVPSGSELDRAADIVQDAVEFVEKWYRPRTDPGQFWYKLGEEGVEND